MKRKSICLLLLLALLVTAGCSRKTEEPVTVSNEVRYLVRVNFYSKSGSLLDQYRIEYDPSGVPTKIASGIMQDQQYENALGGAPLLPDGVKIDKAEDTYKSVLIAPCDDGQALLVSGTAEEPLWGMVLYGDDFTERDGYLIKVTANDGSYAALFYTPLTDAVTLGDGANENSFAVTDSSDYYGYDLVLSQLTTAVNAMENDEPVTLNELLFSPLYASEPRKSSIGYTFMDLDGNGSMELLVGSNGQYAKSVIYDLYAIYNGRIVNVLSSTNGSTHTLDASNNILLDTTNAEKQTVFAAFSYFNSSLRLLDAVIQGGGERFHSTKSFSNADTFESVSYAEAEAIRERYSQVEIEFTPLSEFVDTTAPVASAG